MFVKLLRLKIHGLIDMCHFVSICLHVTNDLKRAITYKTNLPLFILLSVCAHVANGLRHSFNIWNCAACVSLCSLALMWPIVQESFNLQYMFAIVNSCAHMHSCVQWSERYLFIHNFKIITVHQPFYAQEFMVLFGKCQFLSMCPHVSNG